MKLPTEDEIRAMAAGREMDALVAEHVMDMGGEYAQRHAREGTLRGRNTPRYSTKAADALWAARHLAAGHGMRFSVESGMAVTGGPYMGSIIYLHGPDAVAFGNTLELALCRAMLIWKVNHAT